MSDDSKSGWEKCMAKVQTAREIVEQAKRQLENCKSRIDAKEAGPEELRAATRLLRQAYGVSIIAHELAFKSAPIELQKEHFEALSEERRQLGQVPPDFDDAPKQ